MHNKYKKYILDNKRNKYAYIGDISLESVKTCFMKWRQNLGTQ